MEHKTYFCAFTDMKGLPPTSNGKLYESSLCAWQFRCEIKSTKLKRPFPQLHELLPECSGTTGDSVEGVAQESKDRTSDHQGVLLSSVAEKEMVLLIKVVVSALEISVWGGCTCGSQ